MTDKNKTDNYKVVATHKRARFDYAIIETLEVGIVLTGSEVKSLRSGKASINESYAGEMGDTGELYLFNANIPEYNQASHFNHEPKRPRKLLLRGREMRRWIQAVDRKGMTLVALQCYFNHKGRAKITLALAKGKNTVDKRENIKERDWKRDQARLMRHRD